MVFQSYDLFPHLTVLDNILLAPCKVQKRDKEEVKQEGMELTGTVRNVVDFGAFVDIGVHEDGLVHVSQFPTRVSHPSQAVRVGDVVKVRVLSVDQQKKRIALTMRPKDAL